MPNWGPRSSTRPTKSPGWSERPGALPPAVGGNSAFGVHEGEQGNDAGPLDGRGEVALLLGGEASETTGKNLAALGDEFLEEIEAPLREGIAISRDDQRHWQQVWFETHPQPQWGGLFLRWLRPQDQLALVWLEDLALELPARCPAGPEPGDALLVQVRAVDSLRDQLRLEARG